MKISNKFCIFDKMILPVLLQNQRFGYKTKFCKVILNAKIRILNVAGFADLGRICLSISVLCNGRILDKNSS